MDHWPDIKVARFLLFNGDKDSIGVAQVNGANQVERHGDRDGWLGVTIEYAKRAEREFKGFLRIIKGDGFKVLTDLEASEAKLVIIGASKGSNASNAVRISSVLVVASNFSSSSESSLSLCCREGA